MLSGKYSIKYVLPGRRTASLTYLEMVSGTFDGDIDQPRQALIDYCTLNTPHGQDRGKTPRRNQPESRQSPSPI